MEKKERWSEKLLREVENYKCFKNAKVSKLNVWFFCFKEMEIGSLGDVH